MNEHTDRYYLKLALAASEMSRDPSTRVGACIAIKDHVLATGWNSFPRGIAENDRLHDRSTKLELMVHGEMNALLNAARAPVSLLGATLYIACRGSEGIWGGPPCMRCAVHVIQAGIREIVSYPLRTVPSRWHADLKRAELILCEAGVIFRSLPLDAPSD